MEEEERMEEKRRYYIVEIKDNIVLPEELGPTIITLSLNSRSIFLIGPISLTIFI